MSEGIKHDKEKDPWHLMPWDALRAMLQIIIFGANKYSPRNWENGMDWDRAWSACIRHLTSWWLREGNDPESGKSHLWHAGCCILFLIAYELRGIGKDTRPGGEAINGIKAPEFKGNKLYPEMVSSAALRSFDGVGYYVLEQDLLKAISAKPDALATVTFYHDDLKSAILEGVRLITFGNGREWTPQHGFRGNWPGYLLVESAARVKRAQSA